MNVARKTRDQKDGDAEDGRKDQADRRVFADESCPVEQLHKADGDNAHQRRAEQ